MQDNIPGGARRPLVWTIAGTDSGGGAGIHADTRAFDAFEVHGACAVAAVTAQHSCAVDSVAPVAPAMLDAQLAALAADMPPDAIKTGLLASVENLRVVVAWVKRLRAGGRPVPLVVDPVFGATTGASFSDDALRAAYRDELLPLATLATPNLVEARTLAGVAPADVRPRDIDARTRETASLARVWRGFGVDAVVITGGDVEPEAPPPRPYEGGDYGRERYGIPAAALASDWLDSDHGLPCRGWLALPRIAAPHHHGTGCAFASAAAAALAHGFVAADAVVLAKMATAEALRHGWAAGAGAGPVGPRAGFARRLANLPTLAEDRPARTTLPFTAMPPTARGLYAIVDSSDWVARVAAAGVRLIQLRIKDASPYTLVHEIRAALAYAGDAGATLIVNDHWQLALELGAHGVHLGQDDLAGVDIPALRKAGMLLGVSTHSYWEVCRARALLPSYIACGPIHATQLKKMPWAPQGEGNVAYWSSLVAPTPIVAIGGMDADRAYAAMVAGASSVAVVGAITRSADPEAAIAGLQEAIAAGEQVRTHAAPAWARSTLMS